MHSFCGMHLLTAIPMTDSSARTHICLLYTSRAIANKETDKSIAALVSREFRDDKAVRTAINRLQSGEYEIIPDGEEVPEGKKVF